MDGRLRDAKQSSYLALAQALPLAGCAKFFTDGHLPSIEYRHIERKACYTPKLRDLLARWKAAGRALLRIAPAFFESSVAAAEQALDALRERDIEKNDRDR
ncbi:MAG: hypothetical protein KC464_08195 [Myxococcales bacterium]|nr:hypothetical protein [Myxococcales bacterium]